VGLLLDDEADSNAQIMMAGRHCMGLLAMDMSQS
jgi:hypothetical protein